MEFNELARLVIEAGRVVQDRATWRESLIVEMQSERDEAGLDISDAEIEAWVLRHYPEGEYADEEDEDEYDDDWS